MQPSEPLQALLLAADASAPQQPLLLAADASAPQQPPLLAADASATPQLQDADASAPPLCTPITSAALAAATADFSTLLGSGASGAVFAGALDGVPIAVKRIFAPPDATAAVLSSLRRRFRAEAVTLSAFRHPRIVRLLHTCEDTGDAAHPFALVFELLGGGALADWLRAPTGEAPRRGALTPLQRMDAALGVAHGLKYLHGLREVGEDGAQAPVVHRDVKSANIGFALAPAGSGSEMYAKVIDCGLAKALRGGLGAGGGGGGGGGGGASFSAGVLGTPGYMAPELADGLYSVPSEVYSFGVVLLELLRGQRVGLTTASAAREGAEDEGVGHVAALAEACWPPPAAAALAALVVDCTHARPKRRPQTLAPIVARLREVQALLAPPPPLVLCSVCLDEVPEGEGVRCKAAPPAQQHFCCRGCLQRHVHASVAIDKLARNAGGVPCVDAACSAAPWSLEDLASSLEPGALVSFAAGMRYLAIDLPRLLAEREAAQRQVEEENQRIADLAERVRRTRLQVVESDFTLHCPRCRGAFLDFNGCAALYCKDDAGPPPRRGCGIGFCALCLKDCGGDAHAHVRAVHAPLKLAASGANAAYFFSKQDYAAAHRELRLGKLVARLRRLEKEPRVVEGLLAALSGADLEGVGLTVEAVKAAVSAGDAAGAAAAGAAWVCAACTLRNEDGGAAKCGACGGVRNRAALHAGGGGGAAAAAAGDGGGGGGGAAGAGGAGGGAGAGGGFVVCDPQRAVRLLLSCAHGNDTRTGERWMAYLAWRTGGTGGRVMRAAALGLDQADMYEHCRGIIKAGAIAATVEALGSPLGRGADFVLSACILLANLSSYECGTVVCVDRDAAPAAVAALRAHGRASLAITQYACVALMNMSYTGNGQDALVAAGAIPALLATLHTHAASAFVAQSACLALANACRASSSAAACAAYSPAQPFLAALRAHPGNAAVCTSACKALALVCGHSFEHRAQLVAAGAVPLLVAAGAEHEGEARARAHAMLSVLGYSSEGAHAADMPHFSMGAERVVALMQAGAGSARVAAEGADALMWIMHHLGFPDHPAAAAPAHPAVLKKQGSAFLVTHAIPALVAALNTHCAVVAVAEAACLTLVKFSAAGAPVAQACLACGVAPAIAAALRAHPRGTVVLEQAATVLRNLAATGAGAEACLGAGAVEATVAALAGGAASAAAVKQACGALAALAAHGAGAEACVGAGAVEAAVAALGAHGSNGRVAEQACRALCAISDIGAGKVACVGAGAVPALVAALREHAGTAAIAEAALAAVVNLSATALGQEACVASGAVPAITAALRAHCGSSAALAERACQALANIAASGAGEDACVASGAAGAIVAALSAHGGTPSLIFAASHALLCIGWSSAEHREAAVAAGAIPLLAAAAARHKGEAKAKAEEALQRLGHAAEPAKEKKRGGWFGGLF